MESTDIKFFLDLAEEIYLNNTTLNKVLKLISKDNKDTAKEKIQDILNKLDSLIELYTEAMEKIQKIETRKEQAECILAHYKEVSGLIFTTLDNKPITGKDMFAFFKKAYLKGVLLD